MGIIGYIMERGGNNNELAKKALCFACFKGSIKVVEHILSFGMDINFAGIIIYF